MIARLASTAYDKVWGTPLTEPWYQNPERRNVGEIWFAASDSVPLLVKLLFTSDKLSVQVHPGDDYAGKHENSRGKTEMWHVLRAEPDSTVALGVRDAITPARLRESSLSGEIMDLLNWVPARPGDTFFIPAGTIHAIGGGLVLCEVQQFSDVTYRLYDYGRPRELHLERGMDVSCLAPQDCARSALGLGNGLHLLAESDYFRTEKLVVQGVARCPAAMKNTIYVALEGEGLIAGQAFRAGEAWEVSAGQDAFDIESANASFLITAAPVRSPAAT